MFEHKQQPLAARRVFAFRLLKSVAVALGIILGSLGLGIAGYHYLEKLSWLDALLSASMILTGMGPVQQIQTVGGKWFASAYALFSGIVFISVAGVLFAPIGHRLLHKFHLEIDDGPDTKAERREQRKKSGS